MLLALIGAIAALLALSGVHDRQLQALRSGLSSGHRPRRERSSTQRAHRSAPRH
jgi:hypothetical protein